MRRAAALLFVLAAGLAGCDGGGAGGDVDRETLQREARALLDDFHDAASKADGARYFGHFAKDGLFLGTDGSERWTLDEFRAYAKPHFDQGKGWTYRATSRHVDLDPGGQFAWFDEALENAKLGACRGTGVLRRHDGRWKVVQYHLTISIPNDLAEELAKRIKEAGGR
jgi:ketosteroid isomerase-like protein